MLKALRPGEVKILNTLAYTSKSFKDLNEETELDPSILSKYLKRLQKIGLITRDIYSRKYHAEKVCLETLFFNDVLEFMRERVREMINYGKEKGGYIPATATGWFMLTESTAFTDQFRKLLQQPKHSDALNEVSRAIEDYWESYILAKFELKRQKTILEYKRLLLNYVKLLIRSRTKEENETLHSLLVMGAKRKLEEEFPGIPIPKEMIHIRANEDFKEFEKAKDEILRPSSLAQLKRTTAIMRQQGRLKDKLTEKEVEELKNIETFLMKPRNKNIYEKYLQRLKETPKTLIIYSSLGFIGYPEKLRNLVGLVRS